MRAGKDSRLLSVSGEMVLELGLETWPAHTGQGGSQKLPTPRWRARACGDTLEGRPEMARSKEAPFQ